VSAATTFRPWKLDLAYFAVNHLLIGVMLLAANRFAPHVFGWAVNDAVRTWIRSLPLPIEVLALMLAADVVQYWGREDRAVRLRDAAVPSLASQQR
jgi:sterol desaturase/sphingolipid hydroxylase (fatty acid hydroxylase superfamily)